MCLSTGCPAMLFYIDFREKKLFSELSISLSSWSKQVPVMWPFYIGYFVALPKT